MPTSLPLSLTLSKNYKSCQSSEDHWKAAFTTLLGLFEPNVMFFRMCNSPATFQAFMDDLFGGYIMEGWLVIYMNDLLIHSLDQELSPLANIKAV